jgi:hypothetical protein
MDLPKRERSFYFKHTGDSGFEYEGNFTVLCRLSVADKYAQELEKTRLIDGSAAPSAGLSGIASVLSFLRVRIVEGPEWWKQRQGLSIEDEDALVALYDKVSEEVAQWKKDLEEKAAKAKEDLGKTAPA